MIWLAISLVRVFRTMSHIVCIGIDLLCDLLVPMHRKGFNVVNFSFEIVDVVRWFGFLCNSIRHIELYFATFSSPPPPSHSSSHNICKRSLCAFKPSQTIFRGFSELVTERIVLSFAAINIHSRLEQF